MVLGGKTNPDKMKIQIYRDLAGIVLISRKVKTYLLNQAFATIDTI
jgi:hypothetical protein